MRKAEIFNTKYVEKKVGAEFSNGDRFVMDLFVPEHRAYDFDEMINKCIEVKAEKLVNEKLKQRAHKLGEGILKELLT